MLLAACAIVFGFAILMLSADRFILGASAIAKRLGVPPLIVGLTIVALGTSLPELLVSLMAALAGSAELAVGNAIGSNIANMGLVLGCTAIIAPLAVESKILQREYPLLIASMFLIYLLMIDYHLSQFDGLLLLLGLAVLLSWFIWTGRQQAKNGTKEPMADEYLAELEKHPLSMRAAMGWFLLGLLLLPISSHITVWGATHIAESLGISELVIGLTIVALGTSLPELAASVMGALKGEHDIALGNIIGSNMFNMLGVVGLPASITPIEIPHHVLHWDFGYMVFLTLALFITAYGHKKAGTINRFEGGFLLICYIAYLVILYETVT